MSNKYKDSKGRSLSTNLVVAPILAPHNFNQIKKNEHLKSSFQSHHSSNFAINRLPRYLLITLLSFIDLISNMENGIFAASSLNIKSSLNINNENFGLFGSCKFFGRMLGTSVFMTFYNFLNRKYFLIFSLYFFTFSIFSFTFSNNLLLLYFAKFIGGAGHSTLNIYLPIWIDQFGIQEKKTMFMTFIQFATPIGMTLGNALVTFIGANEWKFCILLECVLLFVTISMILFFDQVYFSNAFFKYHLYEKKGIRKITFNGKDKNMSIDESISESIDEESDSDYANIKYTKCENADKGLELEELDKDFNKEKEKKMKFEDIKCSNDKDNNEINEINVNENQVTSSNTNNNNNNMNIISNDYKENLLDNKSNEENKENNECKKDDNLSNIKAGHKSSIFGNATEYENSDNANIGKSNNKISSIELPKLPSHNGFYVFKYIKFFLTNKFFLSTVFYKTTYQFTCVGLSFWLYDYFESNLKIESPSQKLTSNFIIFVIGPVIGLALGGIAGSLSGGYEKKLSVLVIFIFQTISGILALFIPKCNDIKLFNILLCFYFIFSSAVVPVNTGLILFATPKFLKGFASGLSNIIVTILGRVPSPAIYGFLQNRYGNIYNRIGMTLLMFMPILGIIFLGLALIVRYNNKCFTTEIENMDNHEKLKTKKRIKFCENTKFYGKKRSKNFKSVGSKSSMTDNMDSYDSMNMGDSIRKSIGYLEICGEDIEEKRLLSAKKDYIKMNETDESKEDENENENEQDNNNNSES